MHFGGVDNFRDLTGERCRPGAYSPWRKLYFSCLFSFKVVQSVDDPVVRLLDDFGSSYDK